MELIQAVIYGLVQGLTEWLPVSSTAHLRLVSAFSGWQDPGAGFTATIQLGTLLAVFVYFGKDLARIGAAWFRGIVKADERQSSDYKLGVGILVGSIPIVILGFLFKDFIETDLRSLIVIASALIGMGIVLAFAERSGSQSRSMESATVKDGLWIGVWQAIALIPGASRSGSTISGSLFLGFDRASAARFSFLLSTPSVFAAGVYSLLRHREAFGGPLLQSICIANVVSFAVGLASIAFFMKFVAKSGTMPFVVYRIVLGVAILFFVLSGRIEANAGIPTNRSVHVESR